MTPRGWSTYSIHPSWTRFIAGFIAVGAILSGLLRWLIVDALDPMHCHTLVNRGVWLDAAFRNWQPSGCILHNYTPSEGASCLASREIIFVGDSVTRTLLFNVAHSLDPALPIAPPNDERKHADHTLFTAHGTKLTFFWDPFLNASRTYDLARGIPFSPGNEKPAVLVIGSGLWYLRYARASGGPGAWATNMERIFGLLGEVGYEPAELTVVLPVEHVIPSKLGVERAASMHADDIEAMNSNLLRQIPLTAMARPTLVVPKVFNAMLDPSQTEDGLHFSHNVVRAQASVLINLRCNDILPKTFPFDKTCCNSYPRPKFMHSTILGAVFLSAPFVWLFVGSRSQGSVTLATALTTLSCCAVLLYSADRTGLWLKEQKQFEAQTFGFAGIALLMIGLVTVKTASKDPGYLSREQTDEWKGWMQVAILLYHYLGASKVSGIYNPVRTLVAAYLFMTGYGHTTFYLRKRDFGFLRVAQVIIRLNLLTLLLAYTMNADYLSYYFAPLVSTWFLIIYVTMGIGSHLNNRMPYLLGKIMTSAILATLSVRSEWPTRTLFAVLEQVFWIRWSAHEWVFRVRLDLWIVYIGMLAAIVNAKIRDTRLMDHRLWSFTLKAAAMASCLAVIWFFYFELKQESKFIYNLWHPYISFLPVLSFTVLRNANSGLRTRTSRAFSFIGGCSLETFIIQYHFWLAADTKGILLIVPGTEWRTVNVLVTTPVFIYLSHQVARATGDVTAWMCNAQGGKSVPTTTLPSIHTSPQTTEKMGKKDIGASPGSFCGPIHFGLKSKLLIVFLSMWITNVLWDY